MSTVLLCVSAGLGPAECHQAVIAIARQMQREAIDAGLSISAEAEVEQAASTLVSLEGAGAEAFAQSWKGTVQWVAKSTLRPGHRRKNWFIAVHRLPDPVQIPEIDPRDLRFEALRAGGPGGQHQNRTESAVRVLHVPTGMTALARDERSQHRNKALALARLKTLLAAVRARNRDAVAFRTWLARITVERGNPVRKLYG